MKDLIYKRMLIKTLDLQTKLPQKIRSNKRGLFKKLNINLNKKAFKNLTYHKL